MSGSRPPRLSFAGARSVRTTALPESAFVFKRTFEPLLVLGFEIKSHALGAPLQEDRLSSDPASPAGYQCTERQTDRQTQN